MVIDDWGMVYGIVLTTLVGFGTSIHSLMASGQHQSKS